MKPSTQLRDRWKTEYSKLGYPNLETAYLAALKFMDDPSDMKQRIAADKNLSERGVLEKYRKDIAPAIRVLKGNIAFAARQRAGIEIERQRLGKIEIDKTDAAGALRRMELRQFLRTSDERVTLLFDAQNTEFVMAALEMPAALSGVSQEQISKVRDAYVRREHGPALEKLEALEEAVEVVEVGQQMARDAIMKDTGLSSPKEIATWWDSIPEA